MSRLRFLLSIAATLFFSLALCSTTQAAPRTFVSLTGDDANPCSRSAPCRLFQAAHDAVNPGGEVVALDSGGYGTLTINKNVTISGEGVRAVAAPYTTEDAITITTTGLTVVLRSISIEGFGGGGNGIHVSGGASVNLTLQDCAINGFAESGLWFDSSGASGKLSMDNTKITNCTNNGITLNGTGGTLVASIGSSRIESSGVTGLYLNSAKVTIRNSVTSNNVGNGMSLGVGSSQLTVESCEASNNGGDGIRLNDTSSIVRVSRSSVTNNTGFGFNNAGPATFLSRVDVIASTVPVIFATLKVGKVGTPNLDVSSCGSTGSPIFSNTVEGNTAGDFNGTIGTYCSK